MYKVSVIIPVYNTELYLRRCVDSVLESTLKEIEVILVDDGSTDRSGEICDEYATLKNVKVIHQCNSGPSKTRNVGIKASQGEFIGFVDSDDYIDPNMFEQLYLTANTNNADIVTCDYRNVKNNEFFGGGVELPPNKLIGKIEVRDLVCTANQSRILWFAGKSIYNADMIKKNNIYFPNLNMGEETPFVLECMLCSRAIYYVNTPYYFYEQRSDSLTHMRYKEHYLEKLEALYFEKKTIYDKYRVNGWDTDMDKYTMEHTLPLLLSNELNHKTSFLDKVKVYKDMRKSEMLKSAFATCSPSTINSKLKYLAIMLKYRMYIVLALISNR